MSLFTHHSIIIIITIVLMKCSSRDTLTAFTHRDYFNFFLMMTENSFTRTCTAICHVMKRGMQRRKIPRFLIKVPLCKEANEFSPWGCLLFALCCLNANVLKFQGSSLLMGSTLSKRLDGNCLFNRCYWISSSSRLCSQTGSNETNWALEALENATTLPHFSSLELWPSAWLQESKVSVSNAFPTSGTRYD